MAIYASDSGGSSAFEPVPAGTHVAVCDMVVDLGLQKKSSPMYGESVKPQVFIRWQIPAERVEYEKDGERVNKPTVIGKFYTLSLGEKANLRKDLEAWRGRPFSSDELKKFDVAKLLGVPATITVTHTDLSGKIYANVASVGGIPRGMQVPQLEGQAVLYDDEHPENLALLSKGMRERVENQVRQEPPEPSRSSSRQPVPAGELDDDIPF